MLCCGPSRSRSGLAQQVSEHFNEALLAVKQRFSFYKDRMLRTEDCWGIRVYLMKQDKSIFVKMLSILARKGFKQKIKWETEVMTLSWVKKQRLVVLMISEETPAINNCGFQGCILIVWFIQAGTEFRQLGKPGREAEKKPLCAGNHAEIQFSATHRIDNLSKCLQSEWVKPDPTGICWVGAI